MSKEPRQPEAFSLGKFFRNLKSLAGKDFADEQQQNANRNDQKQQLRRDFLFQTANGPAYFSTRDEYCLQVSGGLFRPFDLLEYGPQHPLRGFRTTVVGERGGRLWVLDEGTENATPLQIPMASAKQLIKTKFGFKKIGTNTLKALPEPEKPTAAGGGVANSIIQNNAVAVRHLLKTLPDLMVRVNNGRTMQHLSPMLSADGVTIGWAGVGYVASGEFSEGKEVTLSISGTAAVQ